MDILSNPWFIGLGSSFTVGFLQLIIGVIIHKRKISKNITLANAEVISSIRPVIAENKKLDNNAVKAIIRSKARKYNLGEDDLFDFNSIYQIILYQF